MESPQIETRRLRLLPLTTADLDALHSHWTDPDVRRHLWDDVVIPRERAAAEIDRSMRSFESHGFGYWAVCLKEAPALVGFCGLRLFSEESETEILYSISPAHWGQGLATEAARSVLRYAFENLGLEKIYAGADPPNRPSIRVIEKLGMRFAKKMMLNGQEALYYSVARNAYRLEDRAPMT